MKFLIIGDLHGNKPRIHYKGFDAMIAPGDFCSDPMKKYMFSVLRERLKNPGYDKNWYDLAGKKKAEKMVGKSLQDGRKVLEYLNSLGVPVFVVPGNWDWADEDEEDNVIGRNLFDDMINDLENITNIHYSMIDTGEHQIIGYGLSSGPEYPQHKSEPERLDKEELRLLKMDYDAILEAISMLFREATRPVILLTHNVPFNTGLDMIKDKTSPRFGMHFGSLVARKLIERFHPMVCIGGHMHESQGRDMLGKTLCINAGFGSEANTWLELNRDSVVKLDFHKARERI